MRNLRPVWLFGIVAFEIVIIAGLIAWGVLGKRDVPKSATPPVAPSTTNTKAPVIAAKLVAKGLQAPVAIASTNDTADKRLFVVERTGIIRTIAADGTVAAQPFLDIKAKVHDDKAEMGMLGLAFDPKFTQNGFFYVYYINKSAATTVSRFTLSQANGLADPSSEKILFTLPQPFSNHNGGELQFGPDGYLYAALGDGGSQGDPGNRAQDLNSFFGKILRVDVSSGSWAAPRSNPFVDKPNIKPEIWAWGLRNPWRFSFDRQTGDMYIADVGQGEAEEINRQPKSSKGGENYGWRCMEGIKTYNAQDCPKSSTFTVPIIEYGHTEGRCSVTGGYIYRGSDQAMQGKYFYGDYCGGQIYYAEKKANAWQSTLALQTAFKVSTFGQDSTGNLYVADLAEGTIHRLENTTK
ncbi:MAG TPA: PQQ-dependent sugar dehydrogenase [Candidatus Saccharimonadales bacterium]|nr:PQQ-dependent sugar dehydrogenase [Candidatus Saccharimonadales bacterium]